MKKVLISMITALMMLPMAMLAVVYANEPTPVSGTRTPLGPPRNVVREQVGGNTIITREGTQIWTGGLSGIVESQARQINHPNGEFTTRVTATCVCTVDGVTGILYVNTQGNSDPNEQLFSGTWTITGGEGDLADLHGQGTVTQVFPAPTVYEGSVHFEP